MPDYSLVQTAALALAADTPETMLTAQVVPPLVDAWLFEYNARSPSLDVMEIAVGDFCFLFDLKHERLIAAWGVSHGRHGAPRDKGRMAGHPLGAGAGYHRGHAIPHTLGGPTDINLVPQLGAINIGPFRALEREAVATPGSLYFTYWIYPPTDAAGGGTQQPIGVHQGLVRAGAAPAIRAHGN